MAISSLQGIHLFLQGWRIPNMIVIAVMERIMVVQVARSHWLRCCQPLGPTAKSRSPPTWSASHLQSSKKQQGTSVLLVLWENLILVQFSRAGLMSIHLLLPSLELEWLLQSKGWTKIAFEVTESGWWVISLRSTAEMSRCDTWYFFFLSFSISVYFSIKWRILIWSSACMELNLTTYILTWLLLNKSVIVCCTDTLITYLLLSIRLKWIFWANLFILTLWNWLAIVWRMSNNYLCMNSCLEEVWRIICSFVSFSYPSVRLIKNVSKCFVIDTEVVIAGGSYFQPLSWSFRLKVALGVAKGLAFLHSDERKVIYRDLRTSNILLDSVSHWWK